MFRLQSSETNGLLLVPTQVLTHPRFAAARGTPGRARPLTLMVDTGARFSVVGEDILADLGEPPIGTTDVRTSMQQVQERPVYRVVVSLELVDGDGTPFVANLMASVIAGPPVHPGASAGMTILHRGLLGLDLLRSFRLTYDGPSRTFELTCASLP